MAGIGTAPSHSGTHSKIFWTWLQSKKVSRRVNFRMPHRVRLVTIPSTEDKFAVDGLVELGLNLVLARVDPNREPSGQLWPKVFPQ